MRHDKAIRFMLLARQLGNIFSKDPSSKFGAYLLNAQSLSVISQGYNGLPRGADESKPERHERPLKYQWYEHSERNAVFNLAREQLEGSIVVTTEPPSVSCARALLSVGASKVYFPRPQVQTPEMAVALTLFSECKVAVAYTQGMSVLGAPAPETDAVVRRLAETQRLRTKAIDPYASATMFLDARRADLPVLAQGYSGLPRRASPYRMELYEGEQRAIWVEGSVRYAIYNAVHERLKGCAGVVPAPQCVECARAWACIEAGEVVYLEPTPDFAARWGASVAAALQVLESSGVRTQMLTETDLTSGLVTPPMPVIPAMPQTLVSTPHLHGVTA